MSNHDFIIDATAIISQLGENEQASLSASLTWKLAFSAGNLLAALYREEQPEDSQLEAMTLERLALLSEIGQLCSPDIRPDGSDVATKLGVAHAPGEVGMDDVELAEVMGVSLEEARSALDAQRVQDQQRAEAQAEAARANHAEITRRLQAALDGQVGWTEPGLRLQHRVGEWMAEKLDQRLSFLLQKAARTNRRRVQAQLAADRRLAKATLDELDKQLEKVEQMLEERPEPGL